jgi:type I restriction enzyme S subunit
MPAFKKYKLGELASEEKGAVKSGPFGSNIGSRFFVECGVPVIRGNNLTIGNEKFKDEGFVFLTEEKAAELNCWAVKDDLLFTAAGTIGQVGILTGQEKYERYVISNKQIKVSLNKKLIYPLYAYYWFSSPEIIEYIKNNNTGSTIPLINLSVVKSLPIELPEFPTQTRIASILSSLDDKIELNRRMNQTLEQMAQALFNHYFVDNIDPDNLPEGWRFGSLNEITLNFDSKRVPLSSRQREERKGSYPYYGAASLMGYVDSYIFEGLYILLGEDGTVVDKKGYPILQYVWNKFWVNNHAHVLQGKDYISTNHLYLILKNSSVSHLVSGAVQPKINQSNLNSLKVLIPDEGTCLKFSAEVENLFALLRTNTVEIKTLSIIRDTLLPKLMSGEFDVDSLMKEEELTPNELVENLKTA